MDVLVPGGRDVRGTLEDPGGPTDETEIVADAAVAACPPHPQHQGSRSDRRLRALSAALDERGVACLRFDYGAWDEGHGERRDALAALGWLRERYDRVGLFGYSFGGAIAVLAGGEADPQPSAVAALAPASRLGDLGAVGALGRLECPVQVVYGARDSTADWEPIVDRARERGDEVVEMSADHFFVGQQEKVASRVARFLADALTGASDAPDRI